MENDQFMQIILSPEGLIVLSVIIIAFLIGCKSTFRRK